MFHILGILELFILVTGEEQSTKTCWKLNFHQFTKRSTRVKDEQENHKRHHKNKRLKALQFTSTASCRRPDSGFEFWLYRLPVDTIKQNRSSIHFSFTKKNTQFSSILSNRSVQFMT